VLIESLNEEEGGSKTILTWSNNSLSRKQCAEKQINDTRFKMVTRDKQKVKHNFTRAMGADFHLESVSSSNRSHTNDRLQITVQLRDSCAQPNGAATVQISSVRASTQHPPGSSASSDDSGLSMGLLIALIAIAIVLLLAIFVLIYFCLQRKRPAYKMATSSNEYASKGQSR
jgi:hypothetical protein